MIDKVALNNLNDYELIELYREQNEEAKDFLYQKYYYIIDILIIKYSRVYSKLYIDSQELYSTALLGFSDALNNYRDDKNSKLSTFISLCIERRLYSLVKKYMTEKHKINSGLLSLDDSYGNSDKRLVDVISDDGKNDPLENLSDEEEFKELELKIENDLSSKEREIYHLLINGYSYKEIADTLNLSSKSVDNAIQRIKNKIKIIIDK